MILDKPEAIVSLLKDIKFAKSLNIIGTLEDATLDGEGKLWIQISKENKEMSEAIVKVLKNLENQKVYIIVKCDGLKEEVEKHEV